MRMSIFYDHLRKAAVQRGIPLEQQLADAKDLGYELVEMDFADLQADPAIYDRLQAAGIGVSSIYCFFDFSKAPQQDMRRALVAEALRVGSKKIMPIPGFYSSTKQEIREVERERMLLAMWALVAEATSAGLTVTIEDYDDEPSPIRDSEGMRWFLERLPDLRVTYDTGNFRYSGEEEMHAFDALSDKIVHVHLKDRAPEPLMGERPKTAMDGSKLYPCPIGGGSIPMARIFARLKEIGYDGVLTVEHFDSANYWANMQASAAFVKQYFQEEMKR